MYRSTRSSKTVSSSEAIIRGLAEDGGLFIPLSIPNLVINDLWLSYTYLDMARIIFSQFFDDFNDEEIKYVVEKAYCHQNFSQKIYDIKTYGNKAFLELYHGPTLAFKDMALTALPFLIEIAKKKLGINKQITILTATSGDTGGAALNGFANSRDINIVVLYPNEGISEFQERQMLSFTNEHAKAFAVDGNFDDCQRMVKDIFHKYRNNSDVLLSSANSINIGRLVPQIVYYYAAYCDMVKKGYIRLGEEIDVYVPTGNFGNILAGFLAKRMGLPIHNLVCASNMNSVLTDFFNTKIYDSKRVLHKTNSPSMDILISSNLERLLALICDNPKIINEYMLSLTNDGCYQISDELYAKLNCFKAVMVDEDETLLSIKSEYENDHYLIDPHTAVANYAYTKIHSEYKSLIVSTASPYKFVDAMSNALNIPNDIVAISQLLKEHLPVSIEKVLACNKPRVIMSYDDIVCYLFNRKIRIKAPATSANLGCGFDVVGISFELYNTFYFQQSQKYFLVGFDKEYNLKENNLLVKSYEYVFKKMSKVPIPLFIEATSQDIPASRGLGSSASCIVAGVIAASYFLNIDDEQFLMNTMIELEGHPDNVLPCYLGGLVTSYKTGDSFNYLKHPVNQNLHFIVGCPDFELSTELSRKVLPATIPYQDAIFNLSRIVNLPKAFETGNPQLLSIVMDDQMHQKYRLPLIDDSEIIMGEIKKRKNCCCCISGAGPSLLIISLSDITDELKKIKAKHQWEFIRLNYNNEKVRWEEI